MSISNLLNITVDIQIEVETKSATGGKVKTWDNQLTSVPSKRVPLVSTAIDAYGRLGIQASDMFYFDSEPSVTVAHRVMFEARPYYVRKYEHRVQGSLEYWAAVAMYGDK